MLKIATMANRYGTALILMGALLVALPTAQAADQETQGFFDPLIQRLVADGFNPDQIKQLYGRTDDVFFESRGVSLYFLHNEAKLDYNKMTKRSWIREARVYLKDHADAFTAAQAKFGVDPNVITAIILVETKFGRYTGKRSILNTLSTMAVLTQPKQRDYLWGQLPEERRYSRNKYDQKADRKSSWAYKELKAYLTYTQGHGIDPAQIKGSYAGALGLAQFMPSNILAYGKDGNGDGRIDLFQDADAIFSIASYLKHYGWKPGIDDKKAYKVVYHYNHSKYYVNTILKIRGLLKG
jgi:membrane-bound lytic murein transglycosylase B